MQTKCGLSHWLNYSFEPNEITTAAGNFRRLATHLGSSDSAAAEQLARLWLDRRDGSGTQSVGNDEAVVLECCSGARARKGMATPLVRRWWRTPRSAP